jgi:hypothetical protein
MPGQFFIFTASTRKSLARPEKSFPTTDAMDSISLTVCSGNRIHFWIDDMVSHLGLLF